MKYFYLLLIVVAILFAGFFFEIKTPKTPAEMSELASEGKRMGAGAGKYSCATPEGWKRLDTTIQNVASTYIYFWGENTAFHPNININTEDMSGMSIDEYQESCMTAMSKYMKGFSRGPVSSRATNGNKMKIVRCSYIMDGIDCDFITAIIPKDGIAYNIGVGAPKGHLADYQAAFDEVVNSFRIK